MSVPKKGVYKPQDQTMTIEIESANTDNSVIKATYKVEESPIGPISVSGEIGRFYWTTHKDGSRTPFCINFQAVQRPNGRPYCIVDSWNGYYREDDTMVLTGTRAIVEAGGQKQSFSLETHNFTLQS